MCGIAGILRRDARPPDRQAVAAMLAAMSHRGPDGAATHLAGPLALGHARLAVRDLSPLAAQPLVTGDGDALSIGGNHFIHALRRNVNMTILMFNNRIYGLTKGQYSPTSEVGKVTKSTPMGSIDPPFNPLAVALGAEASFVARTHDLDRKHMIETFRAAHDHRGASFVEIFQNCNVFNDAAFDGVTGRENRPANMIDLKHGEPIRFGVDRERGVVMGADGQLRIVEVADVGEDAILVHDAHRHDPSLAFALARLSHDDHSPTPFGIFRSIERPDYGSSVGAQLAEASQKKGPGDLNAMLRSNGPWMVTAEM